MTFEMKVIQTHVVITKVMGLLRPRDVDSRMTIMMNMNQLKFQEGETIFDLITRYNGLVANCPTRSNQMNQRNFYI
jgi:hypothetical protein